MQRREALLRLGVMGAGGLSLPGLLAADDARAAVAAGGRTGRARSCILLFLWGGPPHQDMFDLKTEAAEGIRTPFKSIRTSADGIEFCELLPQMARVAHRMTVIRSVTHGSDTHEPSCYHMLTGQVQPTLVIPRNNRARTHYPGPCGVLSCLRPSPAGVPSAVTLPRPIMHDGIKYAGTHGGWLGARHDPLEFPDGAFAAGRPVWDFGSAPGLDTHRLLRRRSMVEEIESRDRRLQHHPGAGELSVHRRQAFELLASERSRSAFHLQGEPPALRDRYGRHHYGEAFLLARRLIEAGTRLVTINWMFFRPDGNPLNPWDNHGGTPALGGVTGFEMLKRDYCIPPLDQAYSALITDLESRGMLDETLVVAMGEFGRTPKINKSMGRDHWGACQSVLLAGGGIRGGFVYGASDADGAYPTENPVRPEDLLATMYAALGIPPESELRDAEGRPSPVSLGTPIQAVFG